MSLDLELATSDELIAELIKRNTFAGIIINAHCQHEHFSLENVEMAIHNIPKHVAIGMLKDAIKSLLKEK